MLIGLTGKAGSGKDTLFHLIDERYVGVPIVQKSFAKKLKESAAASLGFPLAVTDAVRTMDALKNNGSIQVQIDNLSHTISGRKFLQLYGTESHRDVFGKDFWLDAALPLNSDHSKELWICTDVRYDNEAERIHSLGGEIWSIIRPGTDKGDTHASEQEIQDIDFTIRNNGTFNDLYAEGLRGLARLFEHVI